MHTGTEDTQPNSATLLTSSFLSRRPCRRLADSPRKFLFFRRHTEGLRNLHARPQFDQPRLGNPGLRIGFRIVDGEIELDGVAIDATITLDGSHFIAVRLALRAEPGLLVESARFDHQRVAFPPAHGVSI